MILSRYLLVEYLKVLLLCVLSFIAILMTTRLEDIARFASYGASPLAILRFAAYQIPYVLPMAIGVAALISSITLVSRLSTSQELTALRSSGMSLGQIFRPILAASICIAALNFILVSEIATTSQLKSRLLKQQISLINPLTLIQSKQLIQNKDLYITSEKRSFAQGSLSNFVVLLWNSAMDKLQLATAKELSYSEPNLEMENFALITSLPGDTLYLENVEQSSLNLSSFSHYLKQKTSKIKNDYLRLQYLLVRMMTLTGEKDRESRDLFGGAVSEIFRRVSVAIATVSFTLLGIAFGLQSGRRKSLTGFVFVILLTALQLILFFSAKSLEARPWITFFLYFAPIAIALFASMQQIKRYSRGIA